MPILLFAFAAAQAVDVEKSLNALKAVNSRAGAVMTRIFSCLDDQVEVQGKADIGATAESVVDGALKACQPLKKELEIAQTEPQIFITPEKAHEITEQWFANTRDAYVKHIDAVLSKPEFAQARTTIAVHSWRECVTNKAADWSRLKDDASTVGQAAVTACESTWTSVRNVLRYDYKSKGLSPSPVQMDNTSEKLHDTMRQVAIETVIAERAKRLPTR